jgi:hypothetical protein
MKKIAQKDSNYTIGRIIVVDDDTIFRKKELA